MAAQTNGLLVHGGLVAEDGSLGQDTGIVDVPVLQNDLELFVQAVGVSLHPARAQGLHLTHALFKEAQAAFDVGLHLGTLRRAHLHELFQCLCGDGGDVLPQLFLVHIRVAGGEDVREAGDQAGGGVVLDAQLLGQIPQGLLVAAGQLLVHGDDRVGGVHVLHGQA